MRNFTNSRCPADINSSRFLRQALLGAAFLGAVAMISLPAARGAGPVGWMPLWLLGMPLSALGALALADFAARATAGRVPAAGAAASAPPRRRTRPLQARRRSASRRGPAPRLPETPAAA